MADKFGRLLNDAGRAVTPAVSERVHARMMEEAGRGRRLARPARRGWRLSWVGVVLVVVVIVLLVPRKERRPQVVSLPPDVKAPSVGAVTGLVSGVIEEVPRRVEEGRFAYLDRDGRRLVRFLLNSVPSVPTEAERASTEPTRF